MAKKNLKYTAEKIDELLVKADEQMATKTDLVGKVDKVVGKGLSTNDYSDAEKAKLAGIQEGAQRNTVTSVRGAFELYKQVGDVIITAAGVGLGNANTRLTSLENNKLDKSEKGATNGVASLDENGRVPSSQLPSYVDDVVEVANYASLPTSGESGKIYITQSDNKTYRWSGNGYAEISASLALGETEQTAYSGAKGKKNAEDIAKLADDLDETYQLAANVDSAVQEIVELTIPTLATKNEAQGYANTAESNANDYTDSEVEKLATVAPIAAGKIVKLTFGWTVSTLISFNATTGWGKDLFYYATYGTGTSVRTQYNFLHQSGALKIYIDETNTGTILYLHNTTQAGTLSVNNLIPSTVSIEEVSAVPENATLIGDEKTLATLTDMRTRLGKTEQAADSAKLGGFTIDDIRPYIFGGKAEREIPVDTDFDTLRGNNNAGCWQMIPNTAYTNAPISNGALLVVRLHDDYYAQLALPYSAGGMFYRAQYWDSGFKWSAWRQVAFTNTKVASATSADTSTNAARLGGVAASEYAKSANVPSLALQGKTGVILYPTPNALSAGWYRIGVTTRTSQKAWTFRMMLRRFFNYNAAETYIIDAAIGYASGAASNVYFTQVAGGIYNSKLIDKVRVTVASNSVSYIDLHISTDCMNNIAYFFDGDAEAYAEGTIVTDETAATYEFSTVDGMSSSHNIIAPKFVGDLEGNAANASKLDGVEISNMFKYYGFNTDLSIFKGGNYQTTTHYINSTDTTITNAPAYYGTAVNFGARVGNFQLFASTAHKLYFRQRWTSDWGDWKTLAFTDSTVANAEKLGGVAAANYMQKSGGTFSGEVTHIENITLYSSTSADDLRVLKFSKGGGNQPAGEILFQAGGGQNGLRIASVHGDWASRQDLVIYTSNNTTAPYAPIWEASLIVKHTGNVGIGTTNPSEKLEVAGNIKASGMLTTGSDAHVGGVVVADGGITSTGDIDASNYDVKAANFKGNLSGTIDRVANTGDNATPIHILGLPTEGSNQPLIDTGVTIEGGEISAGGFKTSGTVDAATLKGNLDGTIEKTTRDTNLFLLGFAQESGAAAKPYVTTQVSVNNGVLTIKGLRVEGDVEITGNTVIGGRVTSAASYQSSPISTASEEGVPSTEEQLRSQISALEERIEALERLIAQNNG